MSALHPRPSRGVLYFRKIPQHVKDKFKACCARRGDSMQDVIHALMLFYARHPDKVKIKNGKRGRKPKPKVTYTPTLFKDVNHDHTGSDPRVGHPNRPGGPSPHY